MKQPKEKAISLRLHIELYEKLVNKAINQSKKDKRIVHISEVIRKILEESI